MGRFGLIFLIGVLLATGCTSAAGSSGIATPGPARGSSAGESGALTHLKVGLLNYMSFGPLFIAQDEGYFAQQGLDVEFVDFGSFDAPMIPALVASQIDVAPMSVTVALLNAIAAGADIKIVADKGFADPNACPGYGWLARRSLLDTGGLSDLSALKGRSIAASNGNTLEWVLDLLLGKAGLTRSDVKYLPITDPLVYIAGLGSGSIDLTQSTEPWITRARDQGVGELWMPFSDLMPNDSLAIIAFGPSILEKNPQAGVRFMTAYLQAIEKYNEGKTESNIAILARHTKLAPDEIRATCWVSFTQGGKVSVQGLLDFQQWALERGYVERALRGDQLWDPEFVDQANTALK